MYADSNSHMYLLLTTIGHEVHDAQNRDDYVSFPKTLVKQREGGTVKIDQKELISDDVSYGACGGLLP